MNNYRYSTSPFPFIHSWNGVPIVRSIKKKDPPPLAVYGMQNKTRVLPRGNPNLLAVLSIKQGLFLSGLIKCTRREGSGKDFKFETEDSHQNHEVAMGLGLLVS